MTTLRNIKGTKDLLPHDTIHWREVENVIHHFMAVHGYGEIRTPVFEPTKLFLRGIGEGTDIVSKEMYSWTDQGGDDLTLRPELTAPVVRAYIQHQMGTKLPLNRLYYMDSLFRRERPQKGRQRQFHQFGIEAIGSPHSEQDAEVITMAYKIYETFGIQELSVKINSIGSSEIRGSYLEHLKTELQSVKNNLCNTCVNRVDKNALRLFDCNNPQCQETLDENAPLIFDHITPEDATHFNAVTSILDEMGIPYVHDKKLVRGLDYYTRTTFEITSSALGAQDALCGGGRYDKLVEELGGKSTPAMGFAAGMERLFIAIENANDDEHHHSSADVYFVTLGQPATEKGFIMAETIREQHGVRVVTETLQRSLKAQMREANRMGVQFVVILGDKELEKGIAVVKNMDTGDQEQLTLEELPHYFVVDGHQ
jgi:histidyl-tRNA synthetase